VQKRIALAKKEAAAAAKHERERQLGAFEHELAGLQVLSQLDLLCI